MRVLTSALFALCTIIVLSTPSVLAQEAIARPNDPINRAEAITAVIRSKEQFAPQVVWFSGNLPEIPLFSDIDQTSWYAPFVEVGFLEGIITGYGDGTFHPADQIIVEHALIVIERVHNRQISVPFAHNKPITRGEFFAVLNAVKGDRGEGMFVFEGTPSVAPDGAMDGKEGIEVKDMSYEKLFGQLPSFAPITDSSPLVLTLPPKIKPTKKPVNHEFASIKQFAISIPSLDISDIALIHPDDPFSQKGILSPLKEGLGHLFAYPGNPGKTMIYGHSSGYPWDISEFTKVFRKINELKSGDRIYITYDGRLHVYEVNRKQIVSAKDVSPFNDDGTSELILYTCWPPDSIKERYLVHAFPVEIVALKN